MHPRTVERIDVISLAKVVGGIGFLWGLIITLAWIATGILGGPFPGLPELLSSTVGSLLGGVIVGGVTAILYNAAASLIGGVELELSDSAP
ncbi:hypothetical protein HSRCO_2009 [Halanaeroarchaeum sp. HSR-CO]|uniref:hypothetical protein n=1 Tax=Halanaeroarchaeum sp. HSR-CO TaxID=2866382 RepID=UPI00217F0220|nr:hypothetical protein [Halanaeroarchaeum sp. HSR-CO]UWG48284.1 hypothetical protein HSRCO_2009 [Halanaeroarchaeum sp. HSR-CO]